MKKKIYVGCRVSQPYEVFKAESDPTEKTHGSEYAAVIGPFRTMRGATFMVKYGRGNPHCQCVNDAERLARQEVVKEAVRKVLGE